MKDIIIIGGGIIGTAIAQALCKYELDILLIEKECECSFGVSKSNSGIIHTGFQSKYGSLSATLAARGNQLYTDLSIDLDFPFRRIGELIVAHIDEKQQLEDLYKNGSLIGISEMKIVDREWLAIHEPNLSETISFALLGSTAGITNPYEACYAFFENAKANNVQFNLSETVENISQLNERWEIRTNMSTYQTNFVINCAGLFADKVSQLADIECETIFPRKGEELLLDRHVGELCKHIIFPLPKPNTKGILIIPTIDHTTMIGPTAEVIDDKEDLRTTTASKDHIINSIKDLGPVIDPATIITAFSGLRPATKLGDFYINEDRKGFINLIGIQSPGLTAAPAIGEFVTSIISKNIKLTIKKTYISKRKSIPKIRDMSVSAKNTLIKKDSDFGTIICRCEEVTKGEILEAIRRGAKTLDGIKFRTRCQMGRCHGSFCTMKIMDIMHEELGIPYNEITKRGHDSYVTI
ncbi:MAG: hypothetical protein A2Y40_07255 [Candidatus Margulisbacteria bacterium GWF2_35_9]|nr:MAG: hypothetical protein A2Y40_07255 [Candidatus Margulisbacteria bacterium GWF2_35_9]